MKDLLKQKLSAKERSDHGKRRRNIKKRKAEKKGEDRKIIAQKVRQILFADGGCCTRTVREEHLTGI